MWLVSRLTVSANASTLVQHTEPVKSLRNTATATDSVRERINVSAAEAPDDVVNRFITAAGVTVEVKTGETVDPLNCSAAEAEAIRNLASIYCVCRITGGSAQGPSFRVGDPDCQQIQQLHFWPHWKQPAISA